MTWLLAHLTWLAWIGCAWSLILLHLAGSLWRWLHPNDDLAQDEQAHAAFYADTHEQDAR